MSSDIKEEMRELRCRILRAVRRRKTRNQHHRFPGEIVFALPKESHTVVGYQIWIIIPSVVEAVLYLLPIHVDAVVVVARIHYEASPFSPSWRYIRTVVFIQIFAKISWNRNKITVIKSQLWRSIKSPILDNALSLSLEDNIFILDMT